MTGRLVLAVAALWAATTLHADVFSYSYTGTTSLFGQTVTGSGNITATQGVGDLYWITGLSGIQTIGSTTTSESLTGPQLFNFVWDGATTSGNFEFLLGSSSFVNDLAFSNGSYVAVESLTTTNTGSFNISRVPEGATITLLLTMGLGVWIFGRRLPSRPQA